MFLLLLLPLLLLPFLLAFYGICSNCNFVEIPGAEDPGFLGDRGLLPLT